MSKWIWFWSELDTHLWKAVIYCLALTLLWMAISAALYHFEGNRSYFVLNAVLLFKILLAAVVFLGRYLLFFRNRHPEWLGWLAGFIFLWVAGFQGDSLFKSSQNWIYVLLKICDASIWTVFTAAIVEVLGSLFVSWRSFEKVDLTRLESLWLRARQETLSLGILLTLGAGLAYYYLTSFYLIDTLIYSYILLVPILAVGPGFYLAISAKVNLWLREDIRLLDLEIGNYIQWQGLKEESEWATKMQRLEYLTLIRSYRIQVGRPKIPWLIGGCYLFFCLFILVLPYIFGLAVEVGSFQ